MDNLVKNHRDENHRAHDYEIPVVIRPPDAANALGIGVADLKYRKAVLDQFQDRAANDDAENRPLPAAQGDAAQHHSRDREQFISHADAVVHLPDIRGVADAGEAGQGGGDHVGDGFHAFHWNSRILRRRAIATDGIEVAPEQPCTLIDRIEARMEKQRNAVRRP